MAGLAVVNLVLGLAYCGLGVMTAIEMKRDWSIFGFSRFGAGFVAIAFTCGPHHLFHGIHLAFEGRAGGTMDLLSVLVGVPFAAMWLFLRVESFAGGRGDRYVLGTPRWLQAVVPVAVTYVVVVMVGARGVTGGRLTLDTTVAANALLVAIYVAIGWFVLRTQLANRPSMGGWSVSGLCLGAIFLTCALMHAVYAAYHIAGRYDADVHAFVIDWSSIPAGLYFLWVVRSLYRDPVRDWNSGPGAVAVELSPVTEAA